MSTDQSVALPAGWDFRPTHVVPQDGLSAWESPDTSRPTTPLDRYLPVQLLARQGAWAQIVCVNGWSAWVDGRLLVSMPAAPPRASGPAARSEDPSPLLARTTEALARYRRASDELASGSLDAGGFRQGTRGLRVGVVIDGESIWLYDEAAGRWMYSDGGRMATYAVTSGPGAAGAAESSGDLDAARGADGSGEPPGRQGAGARAAELTVTGDDAPAPPAGPGRNER
ncbi:hypothetical protein [Streptomyces sp. NPDC006879]|uniref:hypothetical protein n=1 Tax=Streptomyces sp. NPDC006879 TaxID=3364767 RepID=UPI0036C732F5